MTDLQPKVAQMHGKGGQRSNGPIQNFRPRKSEAAQITAWMEERYYWGDVLTELRGALIHSEDDIRKKLSAQKPGLEAGIWIEQLSADARLVRRRRRERESNASPRMPE